MNNIKDIEKALWSAGPGTIISLSGYKDSEGAKTDMLLELLGKSDYTEMQKADLITLTNADVGDIYGEGLPDGTQLTDLIAARAQMIESHTKRDVGRSAYAGAAYDMLTESIARNPDDPSALYLQRLKLLGEPRYVKPAKGAIPRAKQLLARRLNLQILHYVHTIKLSDGKFDNLEIERRVAAGHTG